jgi:hypothetical protein
MLKLGSFVFTPFFAGFAAVVAAVIVRACNPATQCQTAL